MVKRTSSSQTRGAQIGARIRVAIDDLGWTLEEARIPISDALSRKPPISVNALSKWCLGKRRDFWDWEVDAIAKVLKKPPAFFTTKPEDSPTTIRRLVETIDETDNAESVPFVSYEDVAGGVATLDEGIQRSLKSGRLYQTHYPLPVKKFTFEWSDSSMEPMLFDGNSKVTILRKVIPQPGQFVLIRYGTSIFLRPFHFEGDAIVLTPLNNVWRTLRFSPEEWEENVEIMGVLYSHETRVFRAKIHTISEK